MEDQRTEEKGASSVVDSRSFDDEKSGSESSPAVVPKSSENSHSNASDIAIADSVGLRSDRTRAATSSDSNVPSGLPKSVSQDEDPLGHRRRAYSGTNATYHGRSLGTTAPFPGYQQWHAIEHHQGSSQFYPVTGHASRMLTRTRNLSGPGADSSINQGKLRRTASDVVYKLPGPGKSIMSIQ